MDCKKVPLFSLKFTQNTHSRKNIRPYTAMLVYRPNTVRNLTHAHSDEDRMRVFTLFVLKVDNNLYNIHCVTICK